MGLFDSELNKKIKIISNSSLSDDKKSDLIKDIIKDDSCDTPMDDNRIYFKKYYIKVAFVMFIFILIGGLAYYSLNQMFISDKVNKEAVGITNLILGTLLGKASDLFDLIKNGSSKK